MLRTIIIIIADVMTTNLILKRIKLRNKHTLFNLLSVVRPCCYVCLKLTASTTAENAERKKATTQNNIYSIESAVKTQTPVAILRRNSVTSDQKGTLACALPWGFGYGWSTLSNGIWGGGKP